MCNGFKFNSTNDSCLRKCSRMWCEWNSWRSHVFYEKLIENGMESKHKEAPVCYQISDLYRPLVPIPSTLFRKKKIQIKIKTTHRIDHRWISNMTYPKCVHHFSLHSIICICIMLKSRRMIMTYFQAFYGSSNHFMKFTHISSSNWHLNADQSSKYDCCIP